jgi:integrase
MTKTTTSGAARTPVSAERITGDRTIRDPVVPELAQRIRPSKSTWIVHLRSSGKDSKVTLGDCAGISVEQARDLARARLQNEAVPTTEHDTSSSNVPHLTDFAETFLSECTGRWKPSTLVTNRNIVKKRLIPAFGTKRLDRIDREDVLLWMSDPTIGDGAKKRALPVLSSLFDHAELRGIVPAETNPCKGLRRKKRTFKAVYLKKADFAVLGRVLRDHEKTHPKAVAVIRFLALSGSRKSEASGLTGGMIETDRAALPDAKAGPRSIWLGKATRRAMPKGTNGPDFVFGTLDETLNVAEVKEVWDAVKLALGKPNVRLHDLRHSFASVAISMGHDLVVVGGLLGHKDKGSTEGYVHLANKDVAKASKRVGRHLGRIMKLKIAPPPEQTSTFKPPRPSSNIDAYLKSKERLAAFCKAHDLDPSTFQMELRQWRETQSEGAAQ